MGEITDNLAEDLRREDVFHYRASLFVPQDKRRAFVALYLLDHEFSKAAALTDEPVVGLIKLQWWADALAGLREGIARPHPLVKALSQEKVDTSVLCLLQQLVTAKQDQLEDRAGTSPFLGVEQIVSQLETASGLIGRAVCLYLDGGEDMQTLSAGLHIAWSLNRLIWALSNEAVRSRGGINKEILSGLGIGKHSSYSRQELDILSDTIKRLTDISKNYLHKVTDWPGRLPLHCRAAFLGAASLSDQLKYYETQNYSPEHIAEQNDAPLRQMYQLLKAALFGRL